IDESLPLLAALGPELELHDSPDTQPAPRNSIHLRKQPRNLGFAAGNNVALREILYQTDTPYIATLNNDTAADPGWLAALVAAATAGGPRLGMVASTMVFMGRPDTVQSAGIVVHRDGVALDAGLGAPVADLPRGALYPVFGPSAGAALYRRTLLLDAGLF